MKLRGLTVAAAAGLALGFAGGIAANAADLEGISTAVEGGTLFVPSSSIVRPEDVGVRAHTNIKRFIPNGLSPAAVPTGGETPASLACVYGLVTDSTKACIPYTFKTVASGGSKVIAIVDAYDYPKAAADLVVFSSYFKLPAATFQQVYASTKPIRDTGWEIEEALDIQYAHALAPKAKIILVEAKTNSGTDLLAAVAKAKSLVQAAGGGQVSMSWGGGEYSGETSTASSFTGTNVVYFASSGDTGGIVLWPSVMGTVAAVGGTTINRDTSKKFTTETAWSGSGGGISKYVAIPTYQTGIKSIVGTKRGVPDLSADADPHSGVWIYVSQQGGWQGLWGGTSLASPLVAAMTNAAGKFMASSTAELTKIYGGLKGPNFRDVLTGKCGAFSAVLGWDKCTGVGSPKSLAGL